MISWSFHYIDIKQITDQFNLNFKLTGWVKWFQAFSEKPSATKVFETAGDNTVAADFGIDYNLANNSIFLGKIISRC